jgi:hypothetical protein
LYKESIPSGWESIPGLLKRFKIQALGCLVAAFFF